jgi:hypothetical protein
MDNKEDNMIDNSCLTPDRDCPFQGIEGRRFWEDWGHYKTIIKNISDNTDEIVKADKDRNGRIGTLEKNHDKIVGKMLGIGITLSFLMPIIVTVIIKVIWP